MSALAIAAPTDWAGVPDTSLANLGAYSRFVWRSNWLRLAVWALLTVGMIGFVAVYYLRMFGTDWQALKDFGDIAATPPMNALVGVITNPYTLGGAIWCKYWMFGAMMLQIGLLYLTTRNLRGDEDAGRAELTRAYPLGLHSRLLATVWINIAGALVIGVLCGPMVASVISQSDWGGGATGAYMFGLSVATMGILGVGIAAFTNQVAPTNGGANGLGVGAIAVFYVIRMVGDMNSADVLLWISPIGWGQKVDPWGANRAWPMLLQVLLALVLIAVAWMLETRRDLGAGLVAARPGSSKALRLTTTSVGLSLRTQRASIIAWLLGVMIMGDLLGGVVQKMADMIESSGAFTGAAVQAGLNGTVALMAGIMALAITAFAIQSVSTVRANEEAGLAEAQLAGPLSRTGWALRRLAVAFVVTIVVLVVAGGMMGYAYVASGQGIDPSWQTTCVKAVLVYLPAVALLMSVFVLGFGWWPRQCVAVTWAVLALMFIGTIVGVATGIPQRILDLMPYQALPAIPAVPMNWTPVLVESAIAVVFTVAGLAGFRRRNVPVL